MQQPTENLNIVQQLDQGIRNQVKSTALLKNSLPRGRLDPSAKPPELPSTLGTAWDWVANCTDFQRIQDAFRVSFMPWYSCGYAEWEKWINDCLKVDGAPPKLSQIISESEHQAWQKWLPDWHAELIAAK